MTEPGTPTGQMVGFKRHLRVEVVNGEAVYLFSERDVTALKGAEAEALAPLLDGSRDLETVLRDAPAGVAPERVGRFIARLEEAGLVTLGAPPGSGTAERARAYWEAAGVADTQHKRVQGLTTGGVDPNCSTNGSTRADQPGTPHIPRANTCRPRSTTTRCSTGPRCGP